MKLRKAIAALALPLLLLTACAGGPASDKAESEDGITTVKIVLPMAKEQSGTIAYLHAAEALGYTRENGIRFEFESALGSTDGTKLVTTGQAQATYPSPFVSVTARASGLPIVSVFNSLQTNIFGFAVTPGSDIRTIADLKGKKVALGDGGWTVIAAPLLASAGLTLDDVEWVVSGENRQLAVQQGEADAVLTWEMEYQMWWAQGLEFEVFGQDSTDFQCNGIVVSEQLIAEDPDLVKAIVRAAAMGAHFVVTNPEAGARIALDAYPDAEPSTLEGMLPIVEKQAELLTGGNALQDGYGVHNAQVWQELIDSLYADGVIGTEISADDLVTNEFIAYANDFDRDRVEKDAANYEK